MSSGHLLLSCAKRAATTKIDLFAYLWQLPCALCSLILMTLPLCVAAEKQTVKHGGGIVMLQKVGHAAQGEGNCRAGGTRCCSERKLQAVQRFLPGYDIIASQLDFSVWKRMKNLAGNLQPLIYGAFPVCRNYTVRAHLCQQADKRTCRNQSGF